MTKAEADSISKKLRRYKVEHHIYPAPPKGGIPQYQIRIGKQSEFVFGEYTAAAAIVLAMEIERRK